MSLFTLPVTVNDLIQLQFGLQFLTDTSEATTEAGQITDPPGTPTVFSYATQLLGNNISLSQVSMAVDSLMFGQTDNTTELAKLTTQFLPAQASHALASGFNPTVYAAEALGLALAGSNDAFANDFGSLSVVQFASEVGNITGINASAIQGFVHNWINFYTANPSATFGLSVTLASYGAAFGDAVGAALLNPTVNGTLALLTSGVQNALIDNAEGLYQVGIPLITEPPHFTLQGESEQIFLIAGAGGPPLGPTIDWASVVGAGNYAEFVSPVQSGDLRINNAPSTFTLDTGPYGSADDSIQINSVSGNGNLFTLILGDSSSTGSLGRVFTGYSTVEIVALGSGITPDSMPNGIEITGNLVISDPLAILDLGDTTPASVIAQTITAYGFFLNLGATHTEMIDASNCRRLTMEAPADSQGFSNALTGLTVLGADGANNLQGSLGPLGTVPFTNGSSGMVASIYVGADNITGNGGGAIYGDGGPDIVTLSPTHSFYEVIFGEDLRGSPFGSNNHDILAITDGSDQAYFGAWGVGTTPTLISSLFSGASTGGTSADMTTITGFHAFAGTNGDQVDFTAAAWNGDSAAFGPLSVQKGDLVALNGVSLVALTNAQLSAIWVNSSTSSLSITDNVLRYAPADASLQNAQQLAAQLHTSSDAIVLPGGGLIPADNNKHILVAYDASSNVNGTVQSAVNIADVDLVNVSGNNQSSTANLNVYASDMVHLTGVSLTSLTPDNIVFI
jgi:hypothetical protein